jgi:transposase
MKMIFNINTNIEINNLKDLKNLKNIMEVNKLGKPNFSKLAKELGVDRRTVKKYYEGKNENKVRKKKISKIDEYEELIKKLLFPTNPKQAPMFFYKSHLYRFLKREHNLNVAQNTFNHYILNHNDFSAYFKGKKVVESIKSEKPFGEQAQFDWKEKLKFTFKDGTVMLINVACLLLSASRFKVWKVCPSTSQNYLFDFLVNAFELLEGVPKEVLIDNASTMMDIARTEKSEGKVNSKFQQLADDIGFKVKPCMARRPNTKAKVESPMKLIDEIMSYNGLLEDFTELEEKIELLNNEANSRICQATGYAPVLVFKKEKEHLLTLPSDKVCSLYKNQTHTAKVNKNSLFVYKGKEYSVPPEYIGKYVHILIEQDELHIYYSKKMIALHRISLKKVNYKENHHLAMMGKTFKTEINIEELAKEHLKQLESFNEQISRIT